MAEMKKQTEFKLYKRDSVFFDQNTAPVNIAYAHEVNDVANPPLGTIEKNGPHRPNRRDSFTASRLAKKVADKAGATVLPCP
ncbi:MAG: creatininase family protein, partial [Dysosmobacter sp.]|nr:creatininase family protein [Dysosmobacter sp.]